MGYHGILVINWYITNLNYYKIVVSIFSADKGKTKNSKSAKPMSLLNKKDELSSASSEQSLLSDEQEEYDVTEYIMEYTGIWLSELRQGYAVLF